MTLNLNQSQVSFLRDNVLRMAVLIMGVIFFIPGWLGIYEAMTRKNWQPVEGVVLSREQFKSFFGSGKHSSGYNLFIDYKYQVDGKEYKSSGYLLPRSIPGKRDSRIREDAERYSTGKSIPVYYDPARAERSALRKDFHPIFYFYSIGGLVNILLGGLFWKQWAPRLLKIQQPINTPSPK